jgi:hypothetical protein
VTLVLKVIDKSRLSVDQIQQLGVEVEILRSLHHPNIVEVISEDETSAAFYQVFEMSMVIIFLSSI